jgi:type I restriction enzyme, R subunit
MAKKNGNTTEEPILTAAEVIEELIRLSKDFVEMDSEAKAMGLSDFEYAFYTAVASNDSARELMQKDKLRELAVVLTETIRQNASIDRTIKESVRAKLKVAVMRLLRIRVSTRHADVSHGACIKAG